MNRLTIGKIGCGMIVHLSLPLVQHNQVVFRTAKIQGTVLKQTERTFTTIYNPSNHADVTEYPSRQDNRSFVTRTIASK